jgi:hypothetical protein
LSHQQPPHISRGFHRGASSVRRNYPAETGTLMAGWCADTRCFLPVGSARDVRLQETE